MYDPSQAIVKMLGGMRMGNPYSQTISHVDAESEMHITQILKHLGEIKLTAQQAHQRSAGKINYVPLIKKLVEAEAIGHELQRKASSRKL